MTERTLAERAKRRYMRAAGKNGATGERQTDQRHTDYRLPAAFYEQARAASDQPLSSAATVALFALGLFALEATNAATTYYSLSSLMGTAGVLGAPFAVVLTVGLAALDAGGLFKMFGPGADKLNRTNGLWFVMGAWLLCATFNALGTWWAVSSAMAGHVAGNAILTQAQLLDVAPPFVAVALWLMRVMLVAGWAQGERG